MATCAELVAARDPVRFRAAMAAPDAARPGLLALYAFNAEILHAIWATREPGLAEIRLQYWHDQVEALFSGGASDAHPVLNALGQVEGMRALPVADFTGLIAARRWDIWTQPFADTAALQAYLRATGGGLMAMGARLLGVEAQHDPALRDFGQAAALAAFFAATPALKARGRAPLPDESPQALQALAGEALAVIDALPGGRVRRLAAPVLLSASEARPVLKRVLRAPHMVLSGGLERSEFRQRLRALRLQVLGGW